MLDAAPGAYRSLLTRVAIPYKVHDVNTGALADIWQNTSQEANSLGDSG